MARAKQADPVYTPVDTTATQQARQAMDETLWWKPKAGEGNRWGDNLIRILPPPPSLDGKLYWPVPLHFGIGPGNAVVPCPRKAFDQACPICAKGFELIAEGKKEQGLEWLPTWAGYMNVVPLNEDGTPEDGDDARVRIWSASRGIIDDLLDVLDKFGDITSPEKGHDIMVRRRGTGKKNTKYQTTARTEPTAFDYPDLLTKIMDLSLISPYQAPEEMEALVSGGEDPMKVAASAQAPTPALPEGESKPPPGFEPPPADDGEETVPPVGDSTREAAQQHLKDQLAEDKDKE